MGFKCILVSLLVLLIGKIVHSGLLKRGEILESIDEAIQTSLNVDGIDPANQKDYGVEVEGQDLKLTNEQRDMLHPQKNVRRRRKAISATRYRWTANTIPFEYNEYDFSDIEKAEVQKAMDLWAQETCIKFRKATASDKNKILFQTGKGGCNSWMGMVGGTQEVNLSKQGCRWLGVFLHEIGHAIGLVHEHQLPNRDTYIRVLWQNVDTALTKWFDKYSSSYVNVYGTDYDYASVMHYGAKAFSGNGQNTMETIDASKSNWMGNVNTKTLSFTDAKVVNQMYKCAVNCPAVNCPSDGFIDKNCNCITPKSYYDRHCINKHKSSSCDTWATRGECALNPGWMSDNCRKSCDMCPKYGNYL
ncbi:zinc metalloproteinase nas-1-like isoform X2 [Tubulanus polymorphus]|uniref:zinc metalloproteinase nas-1-like isoform X2 n=1 Tax=Tubulanus polymorphus TaxID=672921 RepID=UPI003DA20112